MSSESTKPLSAEAENLRQVLRDVFQKSIAHGLSKEVALERARVVVGSVGKLCREQGREGHLRVVEEIGLLLEEDIRAMPDPPLVVRLPAGMPHPRDLPPARVDTGLRAGQFITRPPRPDE